MRLLGWMIAATCLFMISAKVFFSLCRVGQEELIRECNYEIEAENQIRFKQLVNSCPERDRLYVPKVFPELSTKQILTTELVSGVAVDRIANMSQEVCWCMCDYMYIKYIYIYMK